MHHLCFPSEDLERCACVIMHTTVRGSQKGQVLILKYEKGAKKKGQGGAPC